MICPVRIEQGMRFCHSRSGPTIVPVFCLQDPWLERDLIGVGVAQNGLPPAKTSPLTGANALETGSLLDPPLFP